MFYKGRYYCGTHEGLETAKERQRRESKKAKPGEILGMIALEGLVKHRGLPDEVSYG